MNLKKLKLIYKWKYLIWRTWSLLYKWTYIEFKELEIEYANEYILNLKNLKLNI